jgi:hypothetical protein
MEYQIFPAADFIKLAIHIVGKARNLTIDTGVYRHVHHRSDKIDIRQDIINITPEGPSEFIELYDIMTVITHIDNQLKIVDKECGGRTYMYNGIHKNNNGQLHNYKIYWGS